MRFSCYFKHSWLSVCKHCFPSACILVAQLVYTLSMLSEFQTPRPPPVFYRLDPHFFSHSFESWGLSVVGVFTHCRASFCLFTTKWAKLPLRILSRSTANDNTYTALWLAEEAKNSLYKWKLACWMKPSIGEGSPPRPRDERGTEGARRRLLALSVPLSSLSCSSCSLYLLL